MTTRMIGDEPQAYGGSMIRRLTVVAVSCLLLVAVGTAGYVAGRATATAATDQAQAPRPSSLSITVQHTAWQDDGRLVVRGVIANTGASDVIIPAGAFEFTDNRGQVYRTDTAAQTLAAGATVPFELTVPVPPGRTLDMRVVFAPAPAIRVSVSVPAQPAP